MTLFRTSVLGAAATGLRIATGFALNKIIAVHVGPTGLALIGQFQSFSGIATTVAAAGLNTGVTKYTAEYQSDPAAQARLWNGALRITLAATLLTSVACASASGLLSSALLGTEHYRHVFLVFSVSLLFQTVSGLVLSILNGQRRIALFIKLNVVTNLATFALVAGLTILGHLSGALVASAAAPLVAAAVTYAATRSDRLHDAVLRHRAEPGTARRLLAFSAMAVTSMLALGLSQMAVRTHLADGFGWDAAGHWQAVTRVSDYYLMLLTTSLGIYYLPRLSEIADKSELRKEVLDACRWVIPVAAAGAALIYVARHWISRTLFSEAFLPMAELMPYQLVGDVLKIASWLLGYVMWAKAMTGVFIASEIAFALLYVGLVVVATPHFGPAGATLAFALTYAAYLPAMVVLFTRYVRTP